MQKKMFRLNCLKVRYLYLLQNLLATKAKHFAITVVEVCKTSFFSFAPNTRRFFCIQIFVVFL